MPEADIALYSPDPKGRVTGGFLYNAQLFEQLAALSWRTGLATDPLIDLGAPVHVVDSLMAAHYMEVKRTAEKALFIYHLPPYTGQSVPAHWMQAESLLLKDGRIVVTGTQAFELLQARHRLSTEEMTALVPVITPGIAQGWQRKVQFAELPQNIVVVASIIAEKGIERIIDLLAALRHLNWTCHLYGEARQDSGFYQAMVSKVAALGLSERIVFAGTVARDAVNGVMQNADLLLNFSQFETYSMVTAEAIATGLPVLSFPVGEKSEFEKAKNVRYIAAYDVEEQQRVLTDLLTDKRQYAALCHADVMPVKTWPVVAQQWIQLFQRQIKGEAA